MSRVRAVLQNTVYQGAARTVGVITGLITFALLTRYLGPERFGDYSIALTYTGVLAAIAELGMPVLLLKILSLHRRSDAAVIANLNSLRIFASLIVFLAGVGLAQLLPYAQDVKLGIAIASIGFIFLNFTQYIGVVFQERLKTHLSGLADSIGRLLVLAATFIGLERNAPLSWYFWAFVVGSLATFGGTYFLSRDLFSLKLKLRLRAWGPLLRQALPLMLISLFSLVYFKVDTLILSLLDSSYVVGVYSAAYKYIDVFITIPAIFGALALPFFTRSTEHREEQRFGRQFERSLRLILMSGGLLAAVTFVEADRFITIFSGTAYAESIIILRILALAILPLFLGSLCSTALIARNKSYIVAWIFGSTAVISLVLYVAAIDRFSLYGAAVSTVMVETAIAVATITALLRSSIVLIHLRIVLGYISSVLVLGATLYAAHSLPMVITIAIGTLVYVLLLIAFRVVQHHEISHVIRGTRLQNHR
ncbi:MAG: flippase [bacterium]|nr:flippase [bacterium]